MKMHCSHDCWHGSDYLFDRWRYALARAGGYDVKTLSWLDPVINTFVPEDRPRTNDEIRRIFDNFDGKWERTPDDPLVVLLVHPTKCGIIQPEQALPLADRLAELKGKLPTQKGRGQIRDLPERTQKFIDGLRLAAANGQVVRFRWRAK